MPTPDVRTVIGVIACGLYAWRVQDPKGSYAAFYDASDWLTDQVVAEGAVPGLVRNAINLVLLDQAEGFLLGMVFMTLLSFIFWPVRAGGRWAGRRLSALRRRRVPPASEAEPLMLTEVIPPQAGSSRPGSSARSW